MKDGPCSVGYNAATFSNSWTGYNVKDFNDSKKKGTVPEKLKIRFAPKSIYTLREAYITKDLNNVHLSPVIYHEILGENIFLVSPYYALSFEEYNNCDTSKAKLSEVDFSKQLIEAVSFMHKNKLGKNI